MPIALAFINTPSEPCDFDDDDKVKNLSSPRESAPGSLSREYPLKEIDDEAGAQRRKGANIFAIVSSGCALVSDGYQNSLMTTGNLMFGKLYGAQYTSAVSTRISNALLIGEIIGMIVTGLVTDRIGRKAAILGCTLSIVAGGVMAVAAGGPFHTWAWVMTVARGVVGFGTGGEYPASSTSAIESANELKPSSRGWAFILVTNFVLTIGGFLATFVFLVAIAASKYDNSTSPDQLRKLDVVWRCEFAVGVVLPLAVLYFRLKMMNSQLYQDSAMKRRTPYKLFFKRYWRTLIGTAGTWFLYDFITFPNGIFSATIISSVLGPKTTLLKTMEWNLLLSTLSLPGLFLGAYLVNKIGRKWLLVGGFACYLVLGLVIGLAYDKITPIIPLFIVLYALFIGCGNGSAGNLEGLISAESYPTALRGTGYGLSAAIGKAGAAIGTQAFTPIRDNLGPKWTFIIAAMVGLIGVALAFFFVEDFTSEDLAQQDARWTEFLIENGWTGELGDGSKPTTTAQTIVIPNAVSEKSHH